MIYLSDYMFQKYQYMNTLNTLNRHSRSQHVEIITKTQIALEAIKKYEARHSRMFEKNKQYLNNPYTIFKEIDDHYTRVNYHKELKLDKIARVQILPLNEEYYYISTDHLLFPVRIFLRNVRNQGVLYVGYDREFPGVQRLEDNHSRKDKAYQSQKRLYDCKFVFNKDIMCVLKNEKKKPINKIYLTIVANKELLLLNMKFDYIGYEGYVDQPVNRPKRAFTEGNLQLPPTSPIKRNFQTLYESDLLTANKKQTGQDILKRSKTEVQSSPNLSKALRQLTQPIEQQKKSKNFIKLNLSSLPNHKRSNSKQQIQQKRQKTLQSIERIKANKEQLEEFKQKQKEIKETAAKLKKAIEHYQKIYKQERIRDRKVLDLVTPFIYMNIFMLKSNKAYNKQTKSISRAFTVRYFIKKFSKALRKKYIKSILEIGNFKVRNQMSCLHMFQLASKIVLPTHLGKSAQLIFSTFTSLEPGLILNYSLEQSSRYRHCCRVIQRRWVLKYRARMYMLQNFANRHVELMMKDYPHLRLGLNTFKTGNFCHKVCYEYTVDESAKFRHIYDAYRKRVNEIDEFIIANQKIKQFNKGKPESKHKPYLQIPKKPNPPQHRIFRNLDILKSMIRGWFEIEYKKILKKSISGK